MDANPSITSRPTDANHRDLVERLRKSPLFRDYCTAFQTATGLPLTLRAAGSFQVPLADAKPQNPFCAAMAARSKSCAACLQLQQRVEAEAVTEGKTFRCFAGLNESAVPVRLGDRVIAFLQTGQVMFRAPTAAGFRATLRQLEQWSMADDAARLETAYFQTRVLARPHYEATVRLLESFAHYLSLLSNQLMIQEAAVEPAAVRRASAAIMSKTGKDRQVEGRFLAGPEHEDRRRAVARHGVWQGSVSGSQDQPIRASLGQPRSESRRRALKDPLGFVDPEGMRFPPMLPLMLVAASFASCATVAPQLEVLKDVLPDAANTLIRERIGTIVSQDPPRLGLGIAIGMLVTLWALPATWVIAGIGFLLFRVLDIIKPWPARQFEALHGGLGMMADDVMAAIYGNLVLRGALWLLPAIALW